MLSRGKTLIKKGFFLSSSLFTYMYLTGMDYSQHGKNRFVIIPFIYLFMAIFLGFSVLIIIKKY